MYVERICSHPFRGASLGRKRILEKFPHPVRGASRVLHNIKSEAPRKVARMCRISEVVKFFVEIAIRIGDDWV
jgi:hypothetical protein